MRELTYYVGMTIDGFVAGPDDEVDFFPVTPDVIAHISEAYPETLPTAARTALGVDAPNRHFDTGIQGRSTFQAALDAGITSPYEHLRQLLASTTAEQPDPAVEVVADALAAVRELKAQEGLGIWLIGGGKLAGALLPEIDRLVIKLYPLVVGRGIPLFDAEFSPQAFTLTDTTTLDGGTVVLEYRRA